MGKSYTFTAATETAVRRMSRALFHIMAGQKWHRHVTTSTPRQKRVGGNWYVVCDVCGWPSAEIDSIVSAIQDGESSSDGN